MLPWLEADSAAAPALKRLAAELGGDWRHHLQDARWASENRVAQLLLTGSGLAAWSCLAALLPRPAVIAGYSVGELAAFCAAEVFDSTSALALARDRALAMDAAVAGVDTSLLAVQGPASAGAIDTLCRCHGLALAIQMSTDRVLLGGVDADLQRAETELAALGLRCTRLAVKVASHTPWMQAAARAFALRCADLPMLLPTAPLVCNLDASTPRTPQALRQALAGQIDHPVRWDLCMDMVAERGPRCVLEIGPGHALAKLWNECHPEVPARSADEFKSAAGVAHWVAAQL